LVLGMMGVIAAGAYLTAKLFSHSIVLYVVEETLVQKAPPGTDPFELRLRFRTRMAKCPDESSRRERLMAIAQTLEKTQRLTPDQLEMAIEGCPGAQGRGAH
jgi:hypothetical protein